MEALSLEKVFDLLGTRRVPGDPKQLRALRLRLAELAELNGEPWIRENRRRLLDQWKKAVNLNDKGHHP
jgi:hypothetical protein